MKHKLIHKVLNNGLNIYLYPDQSKHSVALDLIVKYGGFYGKFISEGKEYKVNDGMAHLIEHLMFEKNCKGNFSEIFGKKLMQTNACTWPWITEYYVVATENVSFALENLLIALSKPVFTKEDIEIIKPPIYQEIKMREDQISRRVLYTSTKDVFKNISYVNGLGTKENVEGFDYDLVKKCYDTFYQPKNEILFISGNFNEDKIIKEIENIYKKVDIPNIDFQITNIDEPEEVSKEYDVIKMPIAKDYIDICYKINVSYLELPKRRMFSYYLSLFLNMNFSQSSPLYKELKENKIIDGSLQSNHDFYQNYLLINVGGYVNDENSFLEKVKKVIVSERYNNQDFFDLRLKKLKMQKICEDKTAYGICREFADNILYYDYPDFDAVEEINSLNYQEYLEFINNLNFKHFTVTKVVNND